MRDMLEASVSTVEFTAAGSHKFHMDHIKREGGPELILKALQAAGLHHPPRHWQVIVQKQLSASGETATFKVVEWQRGYIDLKIKPGDVRSAHRVRLIMPSGMNAHEVFHKLKSVADKFDSRWQSTPIIRQQEILGVPTSTPFVEEAIITPPPSESAEPETMRTESDNATSPVKGIVHDAQRMREVLLAIYDLSQSEYPSQLVFVEALAQKMGWGDVSSQRSLISGLFASMNRRGYIEGVKNGYLAAGYKLTKAGLLFIRDLLPQGVETEPLPSPSEQPATPVAERDVTITLPNMVIDPVQLLLDLEEYAKRVAEVAERLRRNRQERRDYQEQVERLDAEAEEMLAPFKDKQEQLLLQMLAGRHVATTAQSNNNQHRS